jgi:hypothetical protein
MADLGTVRPYLRIFKQLDRQAAAELMTLMAADPELKGRMAVVQAATMTSLGHAMGWMDGEQPEEGS